MLFPAETEADFADSARSDSACFFLAFNPINHLFHKSFPSKYICYHKDAEILSAAQQAKKWTV